MFKPKRITVCSSNSEGKRALTDANLFTATDTQQPLFWCQHIFKDCWVFSHWFCAQLAPICEDCVPDTQWGFVCLYMTLNHMTPFQHSEDIRYKTSANGKNKVMSLFSVIWCLVAWHPRTLNAATLLERNDVCKFLLHPDKEYERLQEIMKSKCIIICPQKRSACFCWESWYCFNNLYENINRRQSLQHYCIR